MSKTIDNISKNNIAVIIILAIIAYFIFKGQAKSALQAIGFLPSDPEAKEEKQKEKKEVKDREDFNNSEIWNPKFYKNAKRPAGTKLVTVANADKLATQIYNAIKGAGTNEDAVFGAFRLLPSVAAGSFMAERFLTKYKRDLKSFIDDDLSDSEMSTLGAIIGRLPLYK